MQEEADPILEKWCNDQKSTCPLLCLQTTGGRLRPQQNDCTPVNSKPDHGQYTRSLTTKQSSLTYICVCSNGQQPNASEYSLTIPFHECQEYGNQCVRACPSNDAACQTDCRTRNPCGAQDPKRVNISTTSTGAPSTATATGDATDSTAEATEVYTGFGSDSTATAESGNGNANDAQALVIGFGHTYGLFIVLTIVCGCFTFMV